MQGGFCLQNAGFCTQCSNGCTECIASIQWPAVTATHTMTRPAGKNATYDAIEEAATRLVLDRDFDSVTVEEICREAGVSRRTFFNYFDSKETAVFGLPVAPPLPEARAAFTECDHEDLLLSLVEFCAGHVMFAQRLEGRAPAACVIKRRKVLGRRCPHSVARRAYRTPELINALRAMLTSYFSRHPNQCTELDARVGADRTSGMISLALAAIHLGVFNWVESTSTNVDDILPSCTRALASIRALASNEPDAALMDAGHLDDGAAATATTSTATTSRRLSR